MAKRRILRTVICLCVLGIGVLGAGCGKKPPRYPEDHARFERIVEAVELLRKAYVEKDSQATNELFLPLESLDRLEQEIEKDFQTYSDIVLDFTIERVHVKGDLITVNIRWEGEWKQTPKDEAVTGRGHGILRWSGTQVILLVDVEGDLPFGMASRQALT